MSPQDGSLSLSLYADMRSIDDVVVFVQAYPNQLYAINIATGLERWKFGPADPNGGSICEYTGDRGCLCTIPALSDDGGTVIVGSQDSMLYAIDTMTGQCCGGASEPIARFINPLG